MKFPRKPFLLVLLGILFILPAAEALNLQIPTRPNAFPLEIDTNGGFLVAWGDNSYGQIQVPPGLSNVVQVSVGPQHTLALKGDGSVIGWGDNTYGQTNVPTGLTNAVQVAAGTGFSVALKNDGTVTAWGGDSHGELLGAIYASNVVGVDIWPSSYITTYLYASGLVDGPPAAYINGLTNLVQISKGPVFLEANGSVVATGDNTYGQTNIPARLTNAVQVDAGYGFNVALKSDGSVIAWGYNGYGQTNVPSGLTNILEIAAVSYYSIAVLKEDGTVVAWGDNTYGQTNVPLGLSNVISITGGTTSFAAIVRGPIRKIIHQTISLFEPITNQVLGVPFDIIPPTSSSYLPVTLSIKSGNAKISGNTITPTKAGIIVVAANQNGNAIYYAASQVTTNITVRNYNQDISSFTTIPSKNYPCAPFLVTLPKSTSGLPVTLSVLSGPARVKGNTITVTNPGYVVLGAQQLGNSRYNPSRQVTTSFSALPATPYQYISPFKTIPTKNHGTTFALTLPTASSGLPVAVTVQSGNATINGNTVTLTGTGYVTLAADQGGNQYFNPAPEVTTTFFVQ